MGMNFNLNEEDTNVNPIRGAAQSVINKSLESLKSMKDGDNTLSSDSKGISKMPEVAILKNGIKLGCLKDGEIGRPPSTGRFSYRKKSKKDPNKKIDYFADLTYRFTDGSKKGKWKCDGIFNLTPNVDPDQLQGPVKPSQEQQNYINDLIKSEGAVQEKPSQYQIDKGVYEEIDLNTRNPKLFPLKGKFFVYIQKGAANVGLTNAQKDLIDSYKKLGYLESPPKLDEADKYVKVNLRTIKNGAYKDYFKEDKFMYQPIEKINDVDDLYSSIESDINLQKVDKSECRKSIETLYVMWQKNFKSNTSKVRELVRHAQMCDKQGVNFIFPQIRSKFEKLKNLSSRNEFSLRQNLDVNESRLKSLVRESLITAKKQKTRTLLQERKIVKNRLFFLTENVSVKTKKDRDKFCETLLTEMIYLNGQGFDKKVINEGFWDMIGGIFGKSGSGILGYFKEYLAKWLVTKFTPLDPKGWVGGTIIRAIGNLAIGDIPKLTDCNFLSKLLSKSIAEESIEQLKNRAGLEGAFYDILRNALVDSLEETDLGAKIEGALGSFLCPLLSNVSEKMSGAADKMKTGALAVD